MLSIGDRLPRFSLIAVIDNEINRAFRIINNETYSDKWLILFAWPKDFTFVCPTEIKAFAELNSAFTERNAQILGLSIDSEFVHLAWRQQNNNLNQLPFPMLSDIKRELIQALGIIDRGEGVAQRATFIIDPLGVIRFVMVTDLNVGRNPQEVLRVLNALQTDELCPCNWQHGEATISVI